MNTRERVKGLVERVERGDVLGAFEEFYGSEVVMQENANPPTVGKDANRLREEQFVGSVRELHTCRAKGVLVDGDEAVILWDMEFTNVEGKRLRLEQTSHQVWRDGKIVRERFYYDSAAVEQREVVLA